MRSTSGWIALAGAASIWLSVGDTALARHGHDDSTESLPSVELPAYGAASNRDIEVTVSNTLYFKDKGYLPKDRNWVQIALRVRNTNRHIN